MQIVLGFSKETGRSSPHVVFPSIGIYVRSFDLVFGACLPSWENLKIYVKGRVLQRKSHGCTCRCSGNFAGGGKGSCLACHRSSIAPVRANQFPPSPIADRCKKSRKRFERKIIAKATDTGRGCIAPLPLSPSFFRTCSDSTSDVGSIAPFRFRAIVPTLRSVCDGGGV